MYVLMCGMCAVRQVHTMLSHASSLPVLNHITTNNICLDIERVVNAEDSGDEKCCEFAMFVVG